MTAENQLTEGSITKGLIRFSVPLLLSNLFQQLYNSVDSAVVGSFAGSDALAAVGSTAALINLLIGFFLGIATGTGVLFALSYGAGNTGRLKRLIDSALTLSAAAGLAISILGIFLARPMLLMMDTPEGEVLELSITYLRIYLAGTIVVLIYNVASGILRSEGDSRRPLLYLIIGGVVNLVLDLLFVAVLHMGVAGAAIATLLAQAVSAVLTVWRLTKLDERYRLNFHNIHPDWAMCREIIRVSVPCGLQGSMFNISNLLVQAKINSFGAVAMAGITAYSKIDGFVYMPVMALNLAISTYVGQNIGAGKPERVRKGVRVCLVMSVLFSMALGGLVLIFCQPLLSLFTTDPAAKQHAIQMMWYMAPFAWIFNFSDILGGAVRGAGETMKVTIISAVCICAFRIVWLLTLLHFWNDIRIVFLCYPTSWLLCSVVMAIYYFRGAAMKKALS